MEPVYDNASMHTQYYTCMHACIPLTVREPQPRAMPLERMGLNEQMTEWVP